MFIFLLFFLHIFPFNAIYIQWQPTSRWRRVGEEIVLTTDHLQSAFIIFCFGILLSSLIFIMEIIVAQPWTQKKLNLMRKRGKKAVGMATRNKQTCEKKNKKWEKCLKPSSISLLFLSLLHQHAGRIVKPQTNHHNIKKLLLLAIKMHQRVCVTTQQKRWNGNLATWKIGRTQ